MNKKFAAIVVLTMITLGTICGYIFYMVLMTASKNLLLHCISIGIIYGLINSFVALFFIHRYNNIKADNVKLGLEIRIDSLTGLLNRYAFEHDEKKICNSTNYSVIYLDIDDFSKFNNTYGHDAGDLVLKNVARTIKMSIRPFDKVYRYGGEELIVILYGCSKELAIKIGKTIVKNIRNFDNSPYPSITISAGVATVPDDAESLSNILKAGDIALYKAKELGKDKLVPYKIDM